MLTVISNTGASKQPSCRTVRTQSLHIPSKLLEACGHWPRHTSAQDLHDLLAGWTSSHNNRCCQHCVFLMSVCVIEHIRKQTSRAPISCQELTSTLC